VALTERMRRRLQRGAAPLLEPKETIEDGIRGHVGDIHGGAGIIGLVILSLTSADAQRRVLALTDRSVLYLHTGRYRPSQIKRVLGYWAIGEAPVRIVQLTQRGGGGGSIVEVGGVEAIKLARGPDGTVTEVPTTGAEQMHVAQHTLEEITDIQELVEKATGADRHDGATNARHHQS